MPGRDFGHAHRGLTAIDRREVAQGLARGYGLFPALGLGTLLYESLSVMPHYDDLVRGVIQVSSLVYFLVLTSVFLWAASLTLDRNRT